MDIRGVQLFSHRGKMPFAVVHYPDPTLYILERVLGVGAPGRRDQAIGECGPLIDGDAAITEIRDRLLEGGP